MEACSPDVVRRYANSVETLATAFSTSVLFDTLLLRDAVENTAVPGEAVNVLLGADNTLRSLPRSDIHHARNLLIEWRRSLTPAADAWWWFLDRALPPRIARIEGIALVLSVVIFPFSLGVAIELARLYGNGGIGFASLLPIAATFLGSLSLGGVLSLSFRDRWTALLEEIGFGPRLRVVLTCVLLGLLVLTVALWFARPWFSRHANNAGVRALARQQLAPAQLHLERAVRFDPENRVAHYNLGRVYEDLLDDDRAISEYLVAFAAGVDLAGNNAAHLYLLRGQYDRAAYLLQRIEPQNGDRDLRYIALKNLGWARFGQSRFSEARQLLKEATHVEPDRADAHCLLAKTLIATNDPAAAQKEWHDCLGLTWHEANEPASEAWIGEAKGALEKAP